MNDRKHLLTAWLVDVISTEAVKHTSPWDKTLPLADQLKEAWEQAMYNLNWPVIQSYASPIADNHSAKEDMVFLRKLFLDIQQFNDVDISITVFERCLDRIARYISVDHCG